MLKDRYQEAVTLAEHMDTAETNRELWLAVHGRVAVPAELLARVVALEGRWHLLALSEDWCGDAVNTLPVLDTLATLAPNLEMRVLERDQNPDLMDSHLTNGSRSIPVVMVLDEDHEEMGWWGPRPAELQRWVLDEGLAMPAEDRYREIRRWYARDRGRSTLEEVVSLLEAAARQREGAAA